jgi:prophage regulatory protein
MKKNTDAAPARLLRLREVVKRVGLSRSTVYLRVSQGTFPQSCPLGGRRVAWSEAEIERWIQERIASRQEVT